MERKNSFLFLFLVLISSLMASAVIAYYYFDSSCDSKNVELNFSKISKPVEQQFIFLDQEEIIAEGNTLYVSGMGLTFEYDVYVRLLNKDGSFIGEDYVNQKGEDVFMEGYPMPLRKFEHTMYFHLNENEGPMGYLEVFEYNMADFGERELNKVTVPVQFR